MTFGRGATPTWEARPAAFLLVFCALAVAWTWPLAARLNWRIPHDPGDPLLVTWMLWWNTQAVPLTDAWWNAPIFFPMKGAFALSEHVLGISLFATPIQLAGGSPLFAYNIALLLSFALSGFFAFLLVRHLTGSTAVALCAGVAYAFTPYRASQLSHLQVLTSQWMPLALYGLHRFRESGLLRWLVVFGVATLIQGLSHGYYIFFFAVLFGVWLAWFVDWRNGSRRGVAIIAAWVIASLPLAPILLKYREVQSGLGLSRSLLEVIKYSANPGSFLNLPPMLRFWPDVHAETGEHYLFPGVTVVVLILAATVVAIRTGARVRSAVTSRSSFLFYGLAALVMYALAMGPAPPGSGMRALLYPYTLLMWVPGFYGLRVAARFTMVAVLCLTTAMGLGMGRLAAASPRIGRVLVPVVLTGLVLDGALQRMPLAVPPGLVELPKVPGAAVIELPAGDARVSVPAMYRSMSHGYPVINGYSGYTPPHYAILTDSMRRGDPTAILELARGRPLIIIINDRRDEHGDYRRLVESLPDVELRLASTAGLVYVLPPRPRAPVAPTGDPIPFTVRELPGDDIELDLGGLQVVRSVEFPVRKNYRELADRVAVETSKDGIAWTMWWLDWTGGLAMAAALEDPQNVVVKIALRDVAARYLRIKPARRWVWKEMVVRGPA